MLELNRTFAAGAGQLQTVFFSGPAGELSHTIVTDDRRAIAGEAKLQFFNAVNQFAPSLVEFIIVPPGTDAAMAPPAAALAVSGAERRRAGSDLVPVGVEADGREVRFAAGEVARS